MPEGEEAGSFQFHRYREPSKGVPSR